MPKVRPASAGSTLSAPTIVAAPVVVLIVTSWLPLTTEASGCVDALEFRTRLMPYSVPAQSRLSPSRSLWPVAPISENVPVDKLTE